MGTDQRLGDFLTNAAQETEVVLLGFPSDEGVLRNEGRPGAAHGPGEIREHLYKLTPDPQNALRMSELLSRTKDLGDIPVSGDLELDQQRLGEIVQQHLDKGRKAIILGGGHDSSFGHYLGYHYQNRKIRVVNVDAHPDVRPLRDGLAHSGSPFRQMLEIHNSKVREYQVLGLNRFSVAPEHLSYLDEKSCKYQFCDELSLNEVAELFNENTLLSFDLDVLNQAYAPGVSAPNPQGLRPYDLYKIAAQAGRSGNVHSMDVVELNPAYDRDAQTARVAAVLIWHFLSGLASVEV